MYCTMRRQNSHGGETSTDVDETSSDLAKRPGEGGERQKDSSVLRCDAQQWVQTTRYRLSVIIISNGWRMPSSAEPRGRTESTARDEQPMGRSSNR